MNPDNFAVPPDDALSDLLQTVHLQGDGIVRSATDHPRRDRHPAGTRMLHVVERGAVHLDFPTASATDPIDLGPGDMALLARGEEHVVRADDAGWVTGTFLVDHLVADPLLTVLPAAVVIRAGSPNGSWAALGLELMISEVSAPGPGSRVMLSRLLDLLFIRSLRVWASSGLQASPGWLTAAMDPIVGPVLSAIHRDPTRDWSVDDLAALAALSRSAFATRFTALLGQSPGAYVQRQRLDRAAHLLASTTEPAGRIAARVGYTSEAAFSRAFARAYGEPPRTWRRTVR
ncbi:AraC family transcriptional regulator [Kutzneria sp. CA-103260]|uniref:AraC family transcriptional regulator n=1 Tax=Kutzneria sp. CA-103260 TaxID=2802641 RepID=UPI001BADE0A6|nr:AraC family transcriptional regulator [Kutzneria sp. CA-103260]